MKHLSLLSPQSNIFLNCSIKWLFSVSSYRRVVAHVPLLWMLLEDALGTNSFWAPSTVGHSRKPSKCKCNVLVVLYAQRIVSIYIRLCTPNVFA